MEMIKTIGLKATIAVVSVIITLLAVGFVGYLMQSAGF